MKYIFRQPLISPKEVDQLKKTLMQMNQHLGLYLRYNGLKPVLLSNLLASIKLYENTRDERSLTIIKDIFQCVQANTMSVLPTVTLSVLKSLQVYGSVLCFNRPFMGFCLYATQSFFECTIWWRAGRFHLTK